MKIIAYSYSDPLLEVSPERDIWGLEVDHIYQDLGQRHQLQTLLQDCQENPPNYLLIRRLEELGESLEQVSDRLTQLESLGITIIATEQNYSSAQLKAQPFPEIVENLAKLFDEINLNQRCRQLQKGHAQNRLKCLPPPGKAPYGYRRGKDRYILDRSTAPVVKDFFERFLLLGSLRGTVRYLEKKYGKKIAVSTGHRWLTNPVYRGDLCYKNAQIIPDTHIPIISREEGAQIDRLLRRNQKLPSRTASAPRSLAGLVICQKCQSSMTVISVKQRNKKQEYLYLRPKNCPLQPTCQGRSYQDILNKTIERICQDLPKTVAQLTLPNLEKIKEELQKKIQNKKAIIHQLSTLTEQGILDTETSQLRNYKLQQEIAQIKTQIDQLPPGDLRIIAQAVSLPQFWQDLSEAERRFYFREFIRQILILPLAPKSWELQLVFVWTER
ncbi:Recombinase [Rippkaea orientalis PCC 8801]|uniref:Recombinase n=1 Tax=Rippkaea orientalis (strain PCC 8801 / RF-1) TaxID=41431 RepID=B7JWQ1_RIPO1|nr:recombinase family protein [Rippkaea orientalis]ACK64697.1 Recombinase [Rippkaea orientalis PCC 8801]